MKDLQVNTPNTLTLPIKPYFLKDPSPLKSTTGWPWGNICNLNHIHEEDSELELAKTVPVVTSL